jgi:hypothetical protein
VMKATALAQEPHTYDTLPEGKKYYFVPPQ